MEAGPTCPCPKCGCALSKSLLHYASYACPPSATALPMPSARLLKGLFQRTAACAACGDTGHASCRCVAAVAQDSLTCMTWGAQRFFER
jgi:hypothetical protein